MLKPWFRDHVDVGLSEQELTQLTATSRVLDELLNRAPSRHAAYVGALAFAHKGGLHVSAVMKDPRTYEHVPPESVGNKRQILISDQAGRSNLLVRLTEAGIPFNPEPRRLNLLPADEIGRASGREKEGQYG